VSTIQLETVSEDVRQFFRWVSQFPEGVVIEENGVPVYRIIPHPLSADDGASEPVHVVEG
jgi:hypothetical protein